MSAQASQVIHRKVVIVEVLTVLVWLSQLLKIILVSQNLIGNIVDVVVLFTSIILGVLLIKTIRNDERSRASMDLLAKELKEIDVKKNEFINMAAHELRAPLTAVKGFLSMVISGDAGTVGDKTKEFLIDAAVSTQRMIRLVNNMLNVSRIEDGRMLYTMDNFSLSTATNQIFSEFQIEATQKGLDLSLDIHKKVSDVVYADRDRIEEIMVNFLSNAVKYTSQGSVKVHLYNPTPHVVRFEVIDTGPGISVLEQKRLFQKFYRVEAKVGKTIGTGLGLYISKLLIKKFGGQIGVVSHEKEGSNFWFELPVRSTVSV